MSEAFYYRTKRETILHRAKQYENNTERLQEQARI